MPRQKFCSVPGCLSTTELIKREQESFLSAFCDRCSVGRPCRCPAPDIYTTRKETRTKFTSWCSAIGLKDPGYYINVCYKHFSTGCPSRSCPNPDVVVPIWEKHIQDKLNNIPKKAIPERKQKPQQKTRQLLVSVNRRRKIQVLPNLKEVFKILGDKNGFSVVNSGPVVAVPSYPSSEEEEMYGIDPPQPPKDSHPPLPSPSASSSSSSSYFRVPSFDDDDEEDATDERKMPAISSDALLDQSEDPCLNEGNTLRNFIQNNSLVSPFVDESLESVQKWLDISE